MTELESKTKAAKEAYQAYKSKVDSEASDAAHKAKWKVLNAHRDKLNELKAAYSNAENLREKELDESTTHPWEGKMVTAERDVSSRSSWSRNLQPVFGIVECVRSDTKFSSNLRWTPRPGQIIIRKIKKDGTPSLQYWEQFYNADLKGWALVPEKADA